MFNQTDFFEDLNDICKTYLVEFPEEEHIVIITQVVHFDVRQTVHHQHNEITNAIHSFLAHEQDLTRSFVEEGIPERVLGIVVRRE